MKKYQDREFDLFGIKWTIKYVDKLEETNKEDGYFFGISHVDSATIQIALLDSKGKPLSEETIRITLLHELTHAILGSGSYESSTHDEPMVEWIARCINSLLKQKVI
jgi:hypothetical protein